jgi:glucose/mannose-6-phosphate isomerase
MLLDDAEALRTIDRSQMLSVMERTPARLTPPVDALSTCRGKFGVAQNVIFGGMGGSGIVGDILSDYCRESVDIPVSACRTFKIPKFVGKQTLFVAISYSGETQETLGQVNQAVKQGARIVVITSGGKLLSKAKGEEIPYLQVPADLPPRLALPELVASAIFVMGSAKLIDTKRLLSEAARSLTDLVEAVKPTVPFQSNPAKLIAQTLVNRLPLLIGDESYGSVLRRFKNEINENSKMPAVYFTLPEGYHDDIEGLRSLEQLTDSQPIILRSNDELEGQRRAREQLVRLLGELGFPSILEFEGKGKDMLSYLLTAITFADYVSVYLAALRGLDPTELKLIPQFRKAMRENGRLP